MNRIVLLKSAAFLFALLLCVSGACPTSSGPDSGAAPGPLKIITIEGVTEYRLTNGLEILLYRDESSSTVTVNMTYLVGSRHESYGGTGMAHLLEHMNFKGTPSHPDIELELQKHGAASNASTSYDRTNYYETFPASPANVEWAISLEADRMLHSLIAQKDLDSEMTVVRNELEGGENSPTRILRERVLETAYLWHNYGHPTIGARSDIEHVPIERLRAFYHTYYQPDNATLIVAGKFDEKRTLAEIARIFGGIPKPIRSLPALYTAEPTQDGEREVVLRRSGGEKVLMACYHVPADAHPDSAALSLLTMMLNDQPSGRLHKRLIETKLAVRAEVSTESIHDPGYLMFVVVLPKEGDLVAAREELRRLIAGLASEPFTAAELDRVRTQQQNDYEQLFVSAPRVASQLSENVAVGDWRLLFWDRDQTNQVTVGDVQRVVATYLVPSNLTAGTFIPEDQPVRAAIPETPDIAAMLASYKGGAAVEAGESFDPTPANLESRTRRETIGSIKIAFLERKTRGSRVNVVLSFHFGDLESLKDKREIGDFTRAMLMRGTQKHSRQQLQDELTHLKASLNVSGGANGVRVSLETTRENLPEVLRLVAEILQQPSFPADALAEIKRDELASIDIDRTNPGTLAGLLTRRYLSPYPKGDLRYVPTFDERTAEISSIKVEDLREFHLRFYGIASAEVALVGSIDAAAISKLVAELFLPWKSEGSYERIGHVYKTAEGKAVKIETPDKANAVLHSEGNLKLRDDAPDYPALIVGNEILGGEFLNSRLATRIRQKDGLSYSVASSVEADSWDETGSFSVSAICAPQNIAKVETDIREEIARALASGFSAEEIAAAKSGILESRILGRSNDHEIASALVDQLHHGRDFTWDVNMDKRIEAATPDEILKAMRRYIDVGTMLTVEAGDFQKLAAQTAVPKP